MADWFDTYRKLGQAVLRHAVSDAHRSGDERHDARAFLVGGPTLGFWCQVAGMNAEAVSDAAKKRWSDPPGGVGEFANVTPVGRWRPSKSRIGVGRCADARSPNRNKGVESRWNVKQDSSAIAEPLAEPMALDASSSSSASASAKREEI